MRWATARSSFKPPWRYSRTRFLAQFLRRLGNVPREQPLEIHFRRPVIAGGGQLAVVANVDDVGADLAERDHRGRPLEPFGGIGRILALLPEVNQYGNAELRHPHVGGVQHVVLVREQREAALAPGRAPGVLDDEPLPGVPDDRNSVAAIRPALASNDREL